MRTSPLPQPPHLTTDDFIDLLHDLVDGDERTKRLAHLKVCVECEVSFRRFAALRERLRAKGAEAAPNPDAAKESA